LHVERDRHFKWDPKAEVLDAAGTSRLEENRYYFRNGGLVSWVSVRDPQFSKEDQPAAGSAPNSAQMSDYFLKAARAKGATVDVGDFITGPGK
jgi:hypothetical protein